MSARPEGTPQGGPPSPLLFNILRPGLDRELKRRGHRFHRNANGCNIYVRSSLAEQRVMTSITGFLEQRLKLKVSAALSSAS